MAAPKLPNEGDALKLMLPALLAVAAPAPNRLEPVARPLSVGRVAETEVVVATAGLASCAEEAAAFKLVVAVANDCKGCWLGKDCVEEEF